MKRDHSIRIGNEEDRSILKNHADFNDEISIFISFGRRA
jgi:hypothetical protein